jgi:hypothetical protein
MDHIPDEDMPAVANAAHAVVQKAINVGVFVFAGGLESQKASVVAIDGTVTDGLYPETRRLSADSRSSTCPHSTRRWSGLPRSPSPAAVRKKSGSSCPIPNSPPCTASRIADGDVPTTSDRKPSPAPEQDLPWSRP